MSTSTTVRIASHHKERLRTLQEHWRRRAGRTPNQQELIGHLLDFAARHLDELLAEAAWRPFSPDEIAAIEAEAVDIGVPLDLSTDIDDSVYDWDREMGRK